MNREEGQKVRREADVKGKKGGRKVRLEEEEGREEGKWEGRKVILVSHNSP